ncbi:prepilin-type N-terminal cleavage/methylation domain-containing protein [bacterium]|nr:prepilin-type N-terminal cleavage/methylation domain-containing protein [bacterium]
MLIRRSFKESMKAGFSLVELVAYMAIVAILAAVLVPNITKYYKNAKKSTTQQNLMGIKNAIEQYYGNTSRYPETLRDLIRTPMDESVARKWDGPYLTSKNDELPEDGWGREFVYHQGEPGSGKAYDLYSLGENGEGSSEAEWIRP